MASRYCVVGQAFITNGAVITCAEAGRVAASGNTTLNLTDAGGGGTFTITLAAGCTGTITSGTSTITDSPKALVAGANVITAAGTGTATLNLTLGTGGNTNTVNSWSATSGGVSGASVPTSAEGVVFDANSFTAASQVVTVDATFNCLSMDWTGATNAPTFAGTNIISVAGGSVTFIAAMTHSATGNLAWVSGAGAATLTTNGLALTCSIELSAGGTFTGTLTLGDALTTTGSVSPQHGTFTTGNFAISCGVFSPDWAVSKTLNLGTSVITCTGVNSANATAISTTINANTAAFTISGTGTLALGPLDWDGASFTLAGSTHTVSGAFTCANMTLHPASHTTANAVTFTSGTTVTVSDTFTTDGGARATQLLVQSSTLGTAATINAAVIACTNTDFMDITGAGAATWDLSAQTDIGNCGGNAFKALGDAAFPASAAQTSAGAGNWSGAIWGAGRVPLPQDDVSCSHSVTMDMPRAGKSITFTGTPTATLSVGVSNYGALTLVTGMTYTHANKTNYMRGRGDYALTTNANAISGLELVAPGGTVTLGSALTYGSNINLSVVAGTLTTANFDLTGGYMRFNSVTGATAVMNLGTSTITLNNTGAGANKWNVAGTGTNTLNAGTSTIVITNSTANAQNLIGGGLTYNNVTIAGAGNYALTISGSNTFNTLTIDRSVAAKTVAFTDGTTQTVTNFICAASGTTVVTLTGTGAAGWTLTKAGGGQVVLDYLALSYSTASPANTWYAGSHSYIAAGSVSGWIFGDPGTPDSFIVPMWPNMVQAYP